MTGKGRFSSVTLLVQLSLGCVAGATVGFKPLQSYSVGLNPVAAVAADFNGGEQMLNSMKHHSQIRPWMCLALAKSEWE